MTNKRTADTYWKSQRLARYGFDANPSSVRVHSDESLEHVICRRICGYVLQGVRPWDEEVETKHGRIDVVDFGTPEEEPLAVEFQNEMRDEIIEDKIENYVKNGPCRDVKFYPLGECPTDVYEIEDWIRNGLAGV